MSSDVIDEYRRIRHALRQSVIFYFRPSSFLIFIKVFLLTSVDRHLHDVALTPARAG